jgi:prevent-host-death family protein
MSQIPHDAASSIWPPLGYQVTEANASGFALQLVAKPIGSNVMQIWCEVTKTMIDLSTDIHSLSDFKRKTAKLMNHMKKTGHPVVLTINGKAEMVVQDAQSYQRLLEIARQAEMIEFLRESQKDVDAGRTQPALDALDKLAKKHKLKRKAK